ncbi:protein of unknown function [Pararobbsia alpina]
MTPDLRDAANYLRAYFIARQAKAHASPLHLREHERSDDLNFFCSPVGNSDSSAEFVPCNTFGA